MAKTNRPAREEISESDPPRRDTRLIQRIRPTSILSFGPDTPEIELGPLNILIGPNGAGKSNLIEVISLLQACPKDVQTATRKGGGVPEWIWKGDKDAIAKVDVVVSYPIGPQPLRHVFAFNVQEQAFHIVDERIECEQPNIGESRPYLFYDYGGGKRPMLNVRAERLGLNRDDAEPDLSIPSTPPVARHRSLKREDVEPDLSILSQRRDPEQYPEVSALAKSYDGMRIYREWSFGRNSVFRQPQRTDERRDRLNEDFTNLGMFLNKIRLLPEAREKLLSHLRDVYEGVRDFDVNVEGGTVQIYLIEDKYYIPATRLSDGTLRYLCLLAILCDPDPGPLICIEEPELGLHPDILHKIADLLVDASTRTQLVVTTHSDAIVDSMTDRPENIIVCEKHEGQTEMRRLVAQDLSVWLDKYSLGALWRSGEIGGVRW